MLISTRVLRWLKRYGAVLELHYYAQSLFWYNIWSVYSIIRNCNLIRSDNIGGKLIKLILFPLIKGTSLGQEKSPGSPRESLLSTTSTGGRTATL